MKHVQRHHFHYGLVVILLGINVLIWGLFAVNKAYAGKIPLGVTASGQTIGGMTGPQALVRLTATHEAILASPITVTADSKEYTTTLAELGYQFDTQAMVSEAVALGESRQGIAALAAFVRSYQPQAIPIRVTNDETKLTAFLTRIESELLRDPKDMGFEYTNGALTLTQPEDGTSLDRSQVVPLFEQLLAKPGSAKLVLPISYQKPAIAEMSQVAAAQAFLQKVLAQPLTVEVEGIKTDITPEMIFNFVVFTVENNIVSVTFDETKVKAKAEEISKKVAISPVAKKVSTRDNSTIEEGRDGRRINVAEATTQILNRLKAADFGTPIVLAAEKVDRRVVNESPSFEFGRYPGQRYIEIDLSRQEMNLVDENNVHAGTYRVSTGKWSTPTPIGEFTILNHISVAWSHRFKLYMPHWMAIKRENGTYDGYGIHGLPYWPNGAVEGTSHIGTPVSHGCIRLAPGADKSVYEWAHNGTRVLIHE